MKSVRRLLTKPNTPTRPFNTFALLVAGLLLVVGCQGDGEGEAQPEDTPVDTEGTAASNDTEGEEGQFNWEAYADSQIRVIAYNNTWGRAIQENLGDFTDMTGIEVDLELLQFLQARDRVPVELQSGNADLDAFIGPPQQQGRTFLDGGWYADLSAFADDPNLTAPEYDFDDFRENLISDHTFDGTLVGIPTEVLVSMMFYRADILEEAGLQVPTTFDELRDVLEEIDQPDGVRAWSARGSAASTIFSPFLYHMGADWVSEGNEPGFDTPEGVDAFELYTDLIETYGPPGATDRGPRETLALMAAGDLAMTTDVIWEIVADPDHSVVVDTVEFAPLPGGPGGADQAYTTEALSVSALGDDQEAAWYFVQWATGPEMVAQLQTESGVAGGRQSVEEFADQPQSWVEAYLEGVEGARPMSPDVPEGAEVLEAVETALQEILTGTDVETAVDGAAEEFRQIVGGG